MTFCNGALSCSTAARHRYQQTGSHTARDLARTVLHKATWCAPQYRIYDIEHKSYWPESVKATAHDRPCRRNSQTSDMMHARATARLHGKKLGGGPQYAASCDVDLIAERCAISNQDWEGWVSVHCILPTFCQVSLARTRLAAPAQTQSQHTFVRGPLRDSSGKPWLDPLMQADAFDRRLFWPCTTIDRSLT